MNVLFDKAVSIVQNSKVGKSFVFDIDNIDRFISMSVNLILNEIKVICQNIMFLKLFVVFRWCFYVYR